MCCNTCLVHKSNMYTCRAQKWGCPSQSYSNGMLLVTSGTPSCHGREMTVTPTP